MQNLYPKTGKHTKVTLADQLHYSQSKIVGSRRKYSDTAKKIQKNSKEEFVEQYHNSWNKLTAECASILILRNGKCKLKLEFNSSNEGKKPG